MDGKRVRPKVFYYAYAPRTHSHTTGSDSQLKHSCRLGHSLFREQRHRRELKSSSVFPNFEFLTNVLASIHALFGALFKILASVLNNTSTDKDGIGTRDSRKGEIPRF